MKFNPLNQIIDWLSFMLNCFKSILDNQLFKFHKLLEIDQVVEELVKQQVSHQGS